MSAPAVAVSADGKTIVAAWKDVRAGEPNLYWSFSEGGSFGKESRVHTETRGKQDHPSLVIDDTGAVWVAWEDARSGTQNIWIRSSLAGERRLSVAERKAAFPVLAFGGGMVAAVYEDGGSSEQRVTFARIKAR